MKEFLLAIFFSEVVLLTPQPIDVRQQVELRSESTIEAISPGAAIEIEVSNLVGTVSGISEREKRISELFQPGSLIAELRSEGAAPVVLRYEGSFAWADEGVWLSLVSPEGVPTGVEFESILIKSELLLEDVSIRWRNFRK